MTLQKKRLNNNDSFLLIIVITCLFLVNTASSIHSPFPQTAVTSPSLTKAVIPQLTSTISSQKPLDSPSHSQTISPTVILRGNTFTVTGRLVDLDSGAGIPDEPIYVYWSYFSWSSYESDPDGLAEDYLVGQGTTDSEGYFSISARDSDHSKVAGEVTVYTVFPGDPLLGPIQENRRYTNETILCYATLHMNLLTNTSLLRDGKSFWAAAALTLDNDSLVPSANGESISFNWQGTEYVQAITNYIANITLSVAEGTTIGSYSLQCSFYVPPLDLPFVVGSISSSAYLETTAADWANATRSLSVIDGAGITFSIDEPLPTTPGATPKVVREQTMIHVSGQITNDEDEPFGFPVDLQVYVDSAVSSSSSAVQASTTSNDLGEFNATFVLSGSYLSVGSNVVWVDAASGQGIQANSTISEITLYGNSTMTSPTVNGMANLSSIMAMPGETLRISGALLDAYNDAPVSGMTVEGRWGTSGTLYLANTSSSGTYTINLVVPPTINPGPNNMYGNISLRSRSTQYYTSSNTSFSVAIFDEISFTVFLNNTLVAEDSTITNVGGEPLYGNSSFILQGTITDQFDRPINNRLIRIIIVGVEINRTLSAGNFSYALSGEENITPGTYETSIIYNQDFDFNFYLTFADYPETTTPTTPTSEPTNNNGDEPMTGNILIWVAIAVVGLIIVLAVIYAFGRFRRGKDKDSPSTESVAKMDLQTLMSQIDDAESAKDYRRAIVLSYRAFEIICMKNFGIRDAPTQSPRELARSVAATNRIPVRDVTMLIMKYEEARYSDHKIGKDRYNAARQALHNIQLALKQGHESS
ncbi:MAG: DUF4129 domain-containing protein [Candidatus Heimdallarchaeota archaeon]|nr:DUF4129 domain-containing protein [Candidatus Heimdallarchaeota archaeon]